MRHVGGSEGRGPDGPDRSLESGDSAGLESVDAGPHVVLVGAGHAHALVLDRWARRPPSDVRITLVTDRVEHPYSGMVPGLVAGEYAWADVVVDARTLAARAGADLIVEAAVAVDPAARCVTLEGGRVVAYDVASLDVGSTVAMPEARGAVPPTAAPARPPHRLVEALEAIPPGAYVVVVGGGAGGVEIAAALRGRPGSTLQVRLVEASDRILPGYPPKVSRRVRAALERRGVEVRTGERWTANHRDEAPALVVWATRAVGHPFLSASGLPVDADGFVEVEPTLRARGVDRLFAAGDCASPVGLDVPKAGVHAVRQAPVLARNLERAASGVAPAGDAAGLDPAGSPTLDLEAYSPQRDFLTLLNLGDGTALGTKWGLVAEGRWVRRLKDVIDRRFVERFRA